MAHGRARLPPQKGHASSAPKDQEKRPQGVAQHRTTRRRSTRLQQKLTCESSNSDQSHSSPAKNIPSPELLSTSGKHTTKRRVDALDHNIDSSSKRPRRSPTPKAETTPDRPGIIHGITHEPTEPTNPIEFWARQGQWPQEYFELDMEQLLARKKSLSSLGRKRSNSAASTATPSDQKPREEKSAPYRDSRYETLLETKGSFMGKSSLDISSASKTLTRSLLEAPQPVPEDSLFRYHSTVPSAESLATFGAKHLDVLVESVNEGWNNSIPLAGARPQPDYSVGFRREAFTDQQLAKLSPFLGDFLAGDQSFFMGTYYLYFPFLTCEVKCGAAALDVADRQNAHSMTLAVRAVAELFRAVKREGEVHRQILGFSISHDHNSVRIYGHYPVIDGNSIKYYRHPVHRFYFDDLDGKEKWTAYRFTRNVYDTWMPAHLKNICSAIDQIPSDLDFDAPSLPETGLSQSLESHHLSQSQQGEQGIQPSNPDPGQEDTPGTSFTDPRDGKWPK
ncbi:unnamed protein product [Clonostachys rosea f. rosea IK726]|uniref:DUF7924 domain-containing protein n=2 Tax=Bionectria ochroleuca TaxID=29856 RepID=A0A0B7KC48_BIOOC|nr:unnamed protein product [Clonostachys rosea f. rosea IK726]